MFVVRLIQDCWQGVRNHERVREHPTSVEVEQALRTLDQRRHTLVSLETEGEAHLFVGGGGGRYVVCGTLDGTSLKNLAAGPVGQREVRMTVGGQEADYASHLVVDERTALRAALAFVEQGVLEPQLHWEAR